MNKYRANYKRQTALGDFTISNPGALKDIDNYKYFSELKELHQKYEGTYHDNLLSLKKNNILQIISNLNYYESPSFPTVLVDDKKKEEKVYIYTDIYGREFNFLNLKEKYLGDFKVYENKLAIYDITYPYYANPANASKFAKNGGLNVNDYIKKLGDTYLEFKIQNGVYKVYEISDKEIIMDQSLSIIMDPEEIDCNFLRGLYLKKR